MRFIKTLGMALAGVLAVFSAANAQTKTIKIALEGAYPPWNTTLPDGKMAGFEIELADSLCQRMNVKCELMAQEWDGMIPGLNVGKFDAIMDGMSITEDRLKVIAFSTPYAREPNGFIVEKGGPLDNMPNNGKVYNLDKNEAEAIKAIDEIKPLLKDKTLGVQISTTHSRFVEKYLKDAVEVKQYKTTPEHDIDLAAGRIDLVLADRSIYNASLETPELKNYTQSGPMFVGGVIGNGVGIALRKTDTELKDQFDKAIKEAIADGTIKTLSEKWFKADNTPQD